MSVALFAAGLGDVIRTCYLNASYRVLSATKTPLPVIVASHNPYTIEIFRHHRNAKNFILYDLGHKYAEFLDAGLRGADISRALCEFAGVKYEDLIRGSAEGHVPVFDAPDEVDSQDHIVFQPFAGVSSLRSFPSSLIERIVVLLRSLPWPVYLLTRSYPRSERGKAQHDREDAQVFAGGNVTVLDNLSVPATLNLVKTSRACITSWSSLQQAAWFENKPLAVCYPPKFIEAARKTGYAFGLDRDSTFAREFADTDMGELEAFLRRW